MDSFTDSAGYYGTLLHEAAHSTGHEKRLDDAYAVEELVAELTAAMLSGALGITDEPREDHAKYVSSWLKVLKADKLPRPRRKQRLTCSESSSPTSRAKSLRTPHSHRAATGSIDQSKVDCPPATERQQHEDIMSSKRTKRHPAILKRATVVPIDWPLWLTGADRIEIERCVKQRIADAVQQAVAIEVDAAVQQAVAIAVDAALQSERDHQKDAIKAGLDKARQRGVRLGRAPGHLERVAAQWDEVLRLRAEGVSLEECAKRVGVARSTVQLMLKGIEPKPRAGGT